MEFSAAEVQRLRDHGLAVFRDRLILDAQPPITEPQLLEVQRHTLGPIPDGLRELWAVSFGGEIDYTLRVGLDGHAHDASFTELFFPGSDGYRDLPGWIEAELESLEDASDGIQDRLGPLPFGGFEYSERVYAHTAPEAAGRVFLYAQGLPPAWRMRLNHDVVAEIAPSVAGLFGLLTLDEDPWGAELPEFEPGHRLRHAVDGVIESEPGLGEKLRAVVRRAVFDWRSVIDRGGLGHPQAPEVRRATTLALHRVADRDDVQLLDRLLDGGCPLDTRVQATTTALPFTLSRRAFRATARMLDAGVPLGQDPVIDALGLDDTLAQRLIARDVAFCGEAPRSIAEGGDLPAALRVFHGGRRHDPGEWLTAAEDAKKAAARHDDFARAMRNGRAGFKVSPEEYEARAARLRAFAAALPSPASGIAEGARRWWNNLTS